MLFIFLDIFILLLYRLYFKLCEIFDLFDVGDSLLQAFYILFQLELFSFKFFFEATFWCPFINNVEVGLSLSASFWNDWATILRWSRPITWIPCLILSSVRLRRRRTDSWLHFWCICFDVNFYISIFVNGTVLERQLILQHIWMISIICKIEISISYDYICSF